MKDEYENVYTKITKEEYEQIENRKDVICKNDFLYERCAYETFDFDYNSEYYKIESNEIAKLRLDYKELEKENAELKDYNKKLLQSDIDKQNKIVLLSQKVNDLQKKNAELDCQKNRNKACYSCVNATERCFTNEIGCPCEEYKSYKDENEELNEKLLEQKQYTEFKCNESVKRKEVYEKEHFLLTKATEIIKKLYAVYYDPCVTESDLKYRDELFAEVKQFISEVEK